MKKVDLGPAGGSRVSQARFGGRQLIQEHNRQGIRGERSLALAAQRLEEARTMTTAMAGTAPAITPVPTRGRIFAVDRRPLVRTGLVGLSRRALGAEVEALADLERARVAVGVLGVPPRAVLLGLQPGDDPNELILRARRLGAPIICVLGCSDDDLVRAALEIDADGYLLLEAASAEALQATLAAVESGERVIPARLQEHVAASGVHAAVTVRCLEVLRHLAEGLHDDEIAEQLSISTSSVRKHVATAQNRLRARTRTQVVAMVARNGLL
jgi:DNA-binding NarL/FixJ family response regulator